MEQWELLIPGLTILLGIFGILGLHMWGDPEDRDSYWRVQSFVLVLALAQQFLLYRVGQDVFMTGGMVIDGLSQSLCVSILALGLCVHWTRRSMQDENSLQSQVLFLCAILLALLFVQANRFFIGVIALIGFALATLNALGAEVKFGVREKIFREGVSQTLWFVLFGALLCLFCLLSFGETQIDELRRLLARNLTSSSGVPMIGFLTLLIGFWFLAIPPFHGVWSDSRRESTWSLSLGMTGLMLLVSFNIFLRWGVWVFSRPAAGGSFLEATTQVDVFTCLRLLAGAGLILVPVAINMSSNLRQAVMITLLNPVLQSLYAISFGHKAVFGFATGWVLILPVIVGLLIVSFSLLKLPNDFSLENWRGLGSKNIFATIATLFGLAACAGLGPCFGSVLVENTLRLNSLEVGLLLVNLLGVGVFVARLSALAFQAPRGNSVKVEDLSLLDYVAQGTLLSVLFCMGIFWEPLYRYGAYSIRHFFGDL